MWAHKWVLLGRCIATAICFREGIGAINLHLFKFFWLESMYLCRLHKLHVTFGGFSQIINCGNRRRKSTFGVPGGKYVSISPLYQWVMRWPKHVPSTELWIWNKTASCSNWSEMMTWPTSQFTTPTQLCRMLATFAIFLAWGWTFCLS